MKFILISNVFNAITTYFRYWVSNSTHEYTQAVNNDECAAAQQDYLPATRETIEIGQHDADRLIDKNWFAPILTPERIKPAPMHHVITNMTDGPCFIGNTNIKLTDPCMIVGEIGPDKPTQGRITLRDSHKDVKDVYSFKV